MKIKNVLLFICVLSLLGIVVPSWSSDIDYVKVFPVPFRADEGKYIWFVDLPEDGDITIYTISGEKIKDIHISGQVKIDWDVKSNDGNDLASGVYVYCITSSGNTKTGKLIVIR